MLKKITSEYSQVVFNLPWLVARDEGLFAEAGIEVEFIKGRERDPDAPPVLDPAEVNPFWRHAPFEEQMATCFSACEWGQIRRSDDSQVGGRILSLRPAVVSQGIFVRPDSEITHPSALRDRTVAVNFHAGSHYLTLQLLEGFMKREEIKVVHYGQGKLRYQAMMRGEVDAAMLMEPFIAFAEKEGCHLVVEAHYAGSEMRSPDMDLETALAIDQALRRAVDLLNADKKKYLHYLIEDLPKDLGSLRPEDFRLTRLRYVQPRPYPLEEFQRTRDWMVSWGLIRPDASFEDVVDTRVGAGR